MLWAFEASIDSRAPASTRYPVRESPRQLARHYVALAQTMVHATRRWLQRVRVLPTTSDTRRTPSDSEITRVEAATSRILIQLHSYGHLAASGAGPSALARHGRGSRPELAV